MTNPIKFLTVVLLFMTTVTMAQEVHNLKIVKNIPLTVQEAFESKFQSNDVVWFTRFQGRYDNQQVYEGRFMFDKRYSTAVYSKSGELVAFMARVDYLEIPEAARDYMKTHFSGRSIIDAVLVTRGGSDVTYEIGIYIDNQYVVQIFSKDGEFIRSTRA